ncbi:hypothetical protein ACTQ5K_03025 [Niallia sp. Sow4_A1]|uniref:hypothetical protein n=1 Tax=Bacillaceae TaxID=186817 RepID=UPI0004E12198|nr:MULTISPECIES: hypothetical protein [Bacillaceae]MCF2649964.1 hypothetical protein [Niallia circulans]REB74182.1 hypothetical protein CP883_09940 [Cutibacterium acnes]CAI9391663.1 hypothetical protein BACSP_03082 [Bacillus sp. T2.9-1]
MFVLLTRILIVFISWCGFFVIPKKSIFKFLPVTLFSTIFLLVETLLSMEFKWWKVKGGIKGKINNAFTFIFGPYFVGNIIIFHFTYKKFWLYALLNGIMDYLLAYPLNSFFEKHNFYKLKKVNSLFLFLSAYLYAMLNYGFQKIIDKNEPNNELNNRPI